MTQIVGHISQVIGPVVDVYFEGGEKAEAVLPAIHEALEIKRPNGTSAKTPCVPWPWTVPTVCNEV